MPLFVGWLLPTVGVRVSRAHPKYLGFSGILHTWPVRLARGSLASALCGCGSLADARTLRLELLEELRRMVLFDAYAWVLTDPETSVGSSPLADVPCLGASSPDSAEVLTEVNRLYSDSGCVARRVDPR